MEDNNNVNGAPGDSPTPPSVTSDSLPENAAVSAPAAEDVVTSPSEETVVNPEKEFSETVERLESGNSPKDAVKKSEPSSETQKDERVKDNGKDNALSNLTQEQEQALNKQFVGRPEWSKVLNAAPKEKQKEVRQAMRTIYERENSLHQIVEKQKPHVQTYERLERATGGKEFVENTIQLIEEFQKGSPKAREMMLTLLNDLDVRTGQVLTSQDLVQRNKAIDDQLTQGTLDEAQAQQLRKDLLEIEKARITSKQSETERKQREEHEQRSTVEGQVTAAKTAGNDWEKGKMSSDPDYPSLRTMVAGQAALLRDQHPLVQEGKILTPVEVTKLLDKALEMVKAEAAKLRPPPKPRNGLNGSSSSATSRRQPANAEEAFFQEVERLEARGGRR